MGKKSSKTQRPSLVVQENDLLEILTQRSLLARLRKEAREAEAVLDQKECSVMALLKAGAVVEGHRSAAIESTLGPVRPKYQELWMEHMGQYHGMSDAMSLEVARTKYPPKTVENLVIGEAYPGILDKLQGQC